MIPGETFVAAAEVELKRGRRRVTVSKTGDRRVQAGSHAHFAGVNRGLVSLMARSEPLRLSRPIA
jgi:urease beta subunit